MIKRIHARRWAHAVLSAVLLGATLSFASASPATAENPSPIIFAHRGFVDGKHTENTIAALNHARRNGARAVEVDLMLTKDREMLIMHDVTLNRTTTCKGRVDARTAAQIQSKCRGKVKGESIPKVRQVLKWARQSNMLLILEFKEGGTWDAKAITRLRDMIEAESMNNRVILHSLSLRPLKIAERVDPRLHSQFITNSWADVGRVRDWVDGVNVHVRYLTATRVHKLRADGLLVLARDSENPKDWAKAHRVGAHGLVTDSVRTAVKKYPQNRTAVHH